jgi:beta-1,2-mannobiose phosphorylase / 1,2-beta-oligomannan phosphorylase
MKLTKFSGNPILSPNPKNAWEDLCVLNPGVIYDEANKRFVMLYRAAGNDREHYIYLGLAYSNDGINFKRFQDKPVLSPTPGNSDGGCVEDPRIIKLGDYYYITYASRTYPPGQYWRDDKLTIGDRPGDAPYFVRANNTLTHLCMTKDFINYKKLGRITDSRLDDRDVIIFPEKINGKYARLSRPMEWCGKGFPCKNPSIWLSFSDDMLEWDKPELLMQGKQTWEDAKIGSSCPPIKTSKGWLHIYHGVSGADGAYRAGAVMLDLKNPAKIIARTKDFIMEPEFDFEIKGYYTGCVFPTANVVKDNVLYVYYGAADKYICLATVPFDQFIDDLMTEK